LNKLVVAGESAGANLATAVTLATSYRRKEPWAKSVFDTGVQPKAALPACGLLQVSDPERFVRQGKLSRFVADRLNEVADAYFHGLPRSASGDLELADPLVFLEKGLTPDRPLPPFFAPCGTSDPLIDDSRRLKAALGKLGVRCDAPTYSGEMHAFHAFIFRVNARRCWRDMFQFLGEQLGSSAPIQSSVG
jgi:acetyl esterase